MFVYIMLLGAGRGGSGDSPFCAPGEPLAIPSINGGFATLVIIQTEELELELPENDLIVSMLR